MSSLAGNCFINFAMASRAFHSDLSCSRSLPLAGTRWVQLTLESLCPLLLAVPSINLSNIKIKILGNVGYRIRGWWVRSKSVTSVLCSPPIQFRSFLARNWPPAGLGRLTAPGFFRRCPKLSSARFNRRLTRPKTLGLSLTYILSLSLYLTHTHARTKTHTHTRTHLLTSLPLAFNLAVRNSAFFVQVHFEPIALLAESLNSRVKTPRRPTAPWTSLGLLRRFSFRSSCWKPTWCWSFECP